MNKRNKDFDEASPFWKVGGENANTNILTEEIIITRKQTTTNIKTKLLITYV